MAKEAETIAATSIRGLAAAIGRSYSTTHEYLRRADFPESVPRRGPWTVGHVESLNAWSRGLQPDYSGAGDNTGRGGAEDAEFEVRFRKAERAAKLKLLRARADLAERQREQLDDKYVTREHYKEQLVARAQLFKAAMQRLGKAVELRLEDLDAKTRRRVGKVVDEQSRLMLTEIVRGIETVQKNKAQKPPPAE